MFKTLVTTSRRFSDYLQIVIHIVAFLVCVSPVSPLIFGPQNTQAQSRYDTRIDRQEEDIKDLRDQQRSQATDLNIMAKEIAVMQAKLGILSDAVWGSVSAIALLIGSKIFDWIFIYKRRESGKSPDITET